MAISAPNYTGDATVNSSADQNGKVTDTAVRIYDMVSTAPATDTEFDVMVALAQAGLVTEAPHPTLGTAYRIKDIARKQVSMNYWTATVTYKTPAFDSQNPNDQAPWNQPATVDADDSSVDGALDEDINGNPIVTANNEPIEGLTRPFSDFVLRIRKNFLYFTSAGYYTYKDAVNSDVYLGFPPGVLRVTGLTAQELIHDNQRYAAVTAMVTARKPYRTTYERAWWARVRHEGYYVRESAGSDVIYHALDSLGQKVSKPVLLDADGVRVPDGGSAHWLEFEIFESVPLSGMGFF